MSTQSTKTIQQQQQSSPAQPFHLPQKIPITYIWFGQQVPQDYLISLAQLNYPIQFMKNPPIQRKFSRQLMNIQKSDYYRLQYLYDHGGLYADFDNVIDYECLMGLLEPYRTQDKLVLMLNKKHTRTNKNKEVMNNLIFAPYPKLPILKKILDGIHQTGQQIWGFAGMKYIAQYQQPVELNMDKCVVHAGDWSWFDASNKVLNKKAQPHEKYAEKLLKKRDIIEENEKLYEDIDGYKSREDSLNEEINKVKGQKKRLQQEIKEQAQIISKSEETNKKLEQEVNQYKASQQKLNQKLAKVKEQNQNLQQQIKTPPISVSNHQQNQQTTLTSSQTITWSQDKLFMQGQIQDLSYKNTRLQSQRDLFQMITLGSAALWIVTLIVGLFVLYKKRRNYQFNAIGSNMKTIVEEE